MMAHAAHLVGCYSNCNNVSQLNDHIKLLFKWTGCWCRNERRIPSDKWKICMWLVLLHALWTQKFSLIVILNLHLIPAAKNTCYPSNWWLKDHIYGQPSILYWKGWHVSLMFQWDCWVDCGVHIHHLINFIWTCRENFFQDVGEIVDVRFAVDFDGRAKGFGHVEFSTAEAAKKVIIDLMIWILQTYWVPAFSPPPPLIHLVCFCCRHLSWMGNTWIIDQWKLTWHVREDPLVQAGEFHLYLCGSLMINSLLAQYILQQREQLFAETRREESVQDSVYSGIW